MEMNFSVIWRNHGHWDIYSDKNRLFRIRGSVGEYVVYDDRPNVKRYEEGQRLEFKTVDAAMAWITSTLMYEIPELVKTEVEEYERLRKIYG